MITDFTLLNVATIGSDMSVTEPVQVRAYTVRKRIHNNEPLVVLNEMSEPDIEALYEYLDRT